MVRASRTCQPACVLEHHSAANWDSGGPFPCSTMPAGESLAIPFAHDAAVACVHCHTVVRPAAPVVCTVKDSTAQRSAAQRCVPQPRHALYCAHPNHTTAQCIPDRLPLFVDATVVLSRRLSHATAACVPTCTLLFAACVTPPALRSPNAVNYTLRDCMVVRCCAPVAVGGEVVINYLGRSALTPRSQRQAELEACYGFNCDCKR
jgi:hypothetical protein